MHGKWHKKRISSLSADGCGCQPCPEAPSSSAPATSNATPATSAVPAVSRKFKEYVPRGYEREQCSVAFVSDSFYYFVEKIQNGKKKKYRYYVPDMLDFLLESTGTVCMVVCSGGAAVLNPHAGGATYREMVEQLPSGLQAVIAIACGNDLVNEAGALVSYPNGLDDAVTELCQLMKAKAPMQLAVAGASAATWEFDKCWVRCLLYTSPSPRDVSSSRMPSSA